MERDAGGAGGRGEAGSGPGARSPDDAAWRGVGERPANAGRRLAVLIVVVGGVMVGSVVGLFWWLRATSRGDYQGPEKLKYPEHRPFRG